MTYLERQTYYDVGHYSLIINRLRAVQDYFSVLLCTTCTVC